MILVIDFNPEKYHNDPVEYINIDKFNKDDLFYIAQSLLRIAMDMPKLSITK